jgi:hypothetical protein
LTKISSSSAASTPGSAAAGRAAPANMSSTQLWTWIMASPQIYKETAEQPGIFTRKWSRVTANMDCSKYGPSFQWEVPTSSNERRTPVPRLSKQLIAAYSS